MSIFDVVLLLILSGFVWFGFWFGLIRSIGSLAGVFIGAYVAGIYYIDLANWIGGYIGLNENILKVIGFILVFSLVSRLVGFIFYLIEKAFKVLSIIPFLTTINRLAGALLGFAEGVLILGLLIYVVGRYSFWDFLKIQIESSQIVPYFLKATNLITPFLPEILKKLESFI